MRRELTDLLPIIGLIDVWLKWEKDQKNYRELIKNFNDKDKIPEHNFNKIKINEQINKAYFLSLSAWNIGAGLLTYGILK